MTEPNLDADLVVRRVAEQAASTLADCWVRVAVLEAQLSARTSADPDSST